MAILIYATRLILMLKIRYIAIGKSAKTVLAVIERKTDKLCFTTWTSFSQASLGHQRLIIRPITSVTSKNNMVIANIIIAWTTLSRIMPNMIDDANKVGDTTISGINSFAMKTWFAEIGNERKNQIVFPSNEIDTQDMHVVAIRRLTITAHIYVKSSLLIVIWRVLSRLSIPKMIAAIETTTIIIGPIIVLTKYTGVEKYEDNSFLSRWLNGFCFLLNSKDSFLLT